MTKRYDAIILGGGPAGLTAAIYLARAKLRPLVVDRGTLGGQMVLTYSVANYPGVEEASGHEISQTMLRQARRFGADVISQAEVVRIELTRPMKRVELEDEGVFEAPVVILAPGGRPRTLGLESERRFAGQGISYCATCDGDFFTGKPIVVVGGGNSAIEEAVSLTKYASKVTVLHVLGEFQAQPWAVDDGRRNPKVELRKLHQVLRFEGESSLERVVARDLATGREVAIPAEGAFVFIGYEPNTEPFRGQVELNDRGEILADDRLRTSAPGVFVAGDARATRYRQITTAVADGTIAALGAAELLVEQAREPAAADASNSKTLVAEEPLSSLAPSVLGTGGPTATTQTAGAPPT
jgi:thioredoxin reductase (NADPH)